MKYNYFKAFLLLIISVFITENTFSAETKSHLNKTMVVIIDPGHGGKDPGAVSKGIREKDVVLGIGLKLGKLINENFSDVKVIFTRNTDVFVPLIDRSRIANKNKADLFISLHANFCGTPSTRGTETFFLGVARSDDNLDVAKKENSVILLEDDYANNYEGFDPNLAESYIMFETVQGAYLDQSLSFADDIQRQFQSRINNSNRGVKQAGFLVLRQSSMPSVLIETGFISNPSEAEYLKSDEGQHTIALSVLNAFRKFKSRSTGENTSILAEVKSQTAEHDTSSSTEVKQKTEVIEKTIPLADKSIVIEENASPQKSVTKTNESKTPDRKEIARKEIPIAKVTTSNPDTLSINNDIEKNIFYSVQIAASTTSVEPVAANFKGLKDVRRDKTDKYFRFYVGKEATLESIISLQQKIKLKFPQSFIVSFLDGKRTIVKN